MHLEINNMTTKCVKSFYKYFEVKNFYETIPNFDVVYAGLEIYHPPPRNDMCTPMQGYGFVERDPNVGVP